jgi:putative transposase
MENKTNKKHRKKLKHYNIQNHAHELTFSCYHCYDYFIDPKPCKLFMEKLDEAKNQFLFNLWVYVIMPNHVHILIKPAQDNYEISDILQYSKRFEENVSFLATMRRI